MATRKKANVEKVAEKTVADKIWDKIKDMPIDVFAIPNKTISDYVQRYSFEKDCVHLKVKSSAVHPALEETLGRMRLSTPEKFEISQAADYIIVKLIPTN